MTDLDDQDTQALFRPLTLPCGAVLKTRIAKAAMSDSLGDGRGAPTNAQMRLYERWAEGGAALSIVGEVQGDPRFSEKPGNLVLAPDMDEARFAELARRGGAKGAPCSPNSAMPAPWRIRRSPPRRGPRRSTCRASPAKP